MVLHLHPFHTPLKSGRTLENEWTNVHSLDTRLCRM